MRFPTMWYARPVKPQISLHIREYSMSVKLMTEHNLEFPSLKGGCTGSSESTLVKMPHCWKSHVAAHFFLACVDFCRLRKTLANSIDQNQNQQNASKLFDKMVVFRG